MLQTVKLLLPALIPSWNFFDVIAASPRVEYALAQGEWRAFRPRPERVSAREMFSRLFWNARWNETLFVVACAERLLAEPTAHSEDEIFRRIAADLTEREGTLRFRIVLLSEVDGTIEREVAFSSGERTIGEIAVR